MKNAYPCRQGWRGQGFTLIEVMIVVAIMALLSAIALPSYQEYVRKGRRADARAGLLQAAQWMERAATANGSYPTELAPVLTWKDDSSKYYLISLAAGSSANAYTLVASPVTGKPQAGDRCGNFTWTHRGEAGNTSLASGTQSKECWGR